MTANPSSIAENIWAIVPAAGIGQRMGSTLPKQYLSVNSQTVIEHTLNRLLEVDVISEIVVALNQLDQQFVSFPLSRHSKITTVIGGQERSDSVLAALNSLQKKAKLSDWILVHDAARCCIRPSAIYTLLETLAEDKVGGILGVPSSDTLKHVDSDNNIQKTVDRNVIWQAQTPQLFRYGLLRDALQHALKQGEAITDEASAIEFAGYQPKMVIGHHDNIKITHPEDLAIAEVVFKQQSSLS